MEYTTIGVSVGRTDGPEKVAGAAVYTADLDLPGLATGKLLRSTLPHARLVKVDVEDARRLPGVLGILTPEDVAAAVTWLVSSANPYANGQKININGGG